MTHSAVDLAKKKCTPARAGDPPLSEGEIARLLALLPGWAHQNGAITKTFSFDNYWQTIAFVNATAWVSHHEDHHPDLIVGYDTCRVAYCTHTLKGISENDFICAAKIEALLAP
jgi:4a-hydroxytetrahydrobiopterin dehydratase